MSKGSLFWANASGKLGETVLYRSGGEQRTRTYVAKIKNPKTLAQMKNRLSMRNFAAIYRSFQPILSKSFPNRPAKESGFNAFVKANKSVRSAVVGEYGANMGLSVPYNMLMSKGYLTQFGEYVFKAFGGVSYSGFDLVNHPNSAAIAALWDDSSGTTIETSALWKQVWDALQIPHNGVFTILWGTYEDEGYSLKSYRLTYGSTDAELTALPSELFMAGTSLTGDATTPFLAVSSENAEVLVTAIISYPNASGKLEVTNSRMIVPSEDATIPEDFVEGGFVYQQVLDAYGYNQDSAI